MAVFSRRHYQIVALALHRAYMAHTRSINPSARNAGSDAILEATHLIADSFGDDNPAFNREHFLAVVRGDRPVNSRPPSSKAGLHDPGNERFDVGHLNDARFGNDEPD